MADNNNDAISGNELFKISSVLFALGEETYRQTYRNNIIRLWDVIKSHAHCEARPSCDDCPNVPQCETLYYIAEGVNYMVENGDVIRTFVEVRDGNKGDKTE